MERNRVIASILGTAVLAALLAVPVGRPDADRGARAESPGVSATAPATAPATQPATRPDQARRVHLLISGKVQGVGFRDFTVAKATALGLTGWVRNLPDKRVEAVAEGRSDKVDELLDAVRKGPRTARVDDVQVEEQKPTGEFPDFTRR